MRRSPIRRLVLCSVVATGWALSGGVTPSRAQAAPAQGPNAVAFHIFQDAVQNARTVYARLAGPQPRVVPGLVQYQDALAKLQAGQFFEALRVMQTAIRANGNNALYHGDMAAIQIGLQSVDDASLELVRARQLQPQNQWYTLALGAVKALRQQYNDASVNLDAAVAADSTIVDSVVAEAGVAWSWRGRRTAQAQTWALLSTQRWPGTPEPWLRLATIYRQQRDSVRGMPAMQRYFTMRPADHVGQLLYAFYLFDAGRNDSALAMATAAAEDSVQRDRAAEVMYGVGARAFQAAGNDTVPATSAPRLDTALLALGRSKAAASDELRPRVQLVLGYAQLTRARDLVLVVARNHQCPAAMQLDTLVTQAGDNLHAGFAVDSTRVAPILATILPDYQTRSAALLHQACPAPHP